MEGALSVIPLADRPMSFACTCCVPAALGLGMRANETGLPQARHRLGDILVCPARPRSWPAPGWNPSHGPDL